MQMCLTMPYSNTLMIYHKLLINCHSLVLPMSLAYYIGFVAWVLELQNGVVWARSMLGWVFFWFCFGDVAPVLVSLPACLFLRMCVSSGFVEGEGLLLRN